MGKIYECKSSFRAEVGGIKAIVRRGDTIREGHPLLVQHPDHFTVLVPRFEYEAPKPPPPPPAPAPPAKKVTPPPAPPKKAND